MKSRVEGILALIILKPCSNFREFTIGIRVIQGILVSQSPGFTASGSQNHLLIGVGAAPVSPTCCFGPPEHSVSMLGFLCRYCSYVVPG